MSLAAILGIGVVLALAGCTKTTLLGKYTWLDPTKNIAAGEHSEVVPVISQVDPMEDSQEMLKHAEPPTLEDLRWEEQDYVVGARDILSIQIMNLYLEGQLYPVEREVSDDGYIMLPEIPDRVRVGEMSVEQVRQAVTQAYQMHQYLKQPSVNVQVMARRQSYFNVIGAVQRPSVYEVRFREFRLLDALTMAGDVNTINVPYVYVIRQTSAGRGLGRRAEPSASVTPPPGQVHSTAAPGEAPGPQAVPAVQEEDLLETLRQFMPGAPPPDAPPDAPPSDAPLASPSAPLPEQAPASAPGQQLQKELDALKSPLPPGVGIPEPQPIRPAIMHMAETARPTGTTRRTRTNAGQWQFINDQWVLVPSSQPIEPAPAPSAPIEPPIVPVEPPIVPVEPPVVPVETTPAPTLPPEPPARPAARRTDPWGTPVEPAPEPRAPAAPTIPAPTIPAPTIPALPVPAEPMAPPTAAPSVPADEEDPFNWAQADQSHLVRVIAVDLKLLKEADPRQNIVIRDRDTILVPLPTYGEYYLMGEVNRPGAYPLTGRKITVKMALATAGGMNFLAWPSNALLIRRLEHGQELRKPIRIDRIVEGKDPDIILQPDDVIAVGTHVAAPFLAVTRSAFRMTYGFGFLYDRNFSEKNFGQFQGPEDVIPFFR